MRRSKTLLRRLLVGLRSRLDEELRARKVTSSQLRLLKEVQENPGASGASLARACYVTPQSAQTMLSRAVERGWIVRGTDPVNHRLVTARLTPAGTRLLAHAESVFARLESEVWAGVTHEDLRTMNAALERGLTNLGD